MFNLPPLRRLLLPALILLAIIVFYKSGIRDVSAIPAVPYLIRHRPSPSEGIHVPITALPLVNASSNHLSPPKEYYYSFPKETPRAKNGTELTSTWAYPILNPSLAVLFKCPREPNRYTNHVRLPHPIRNISMRMPDMDKPDKRVFWNPTVLSLPSWSKTQYIIVSRIVTDGNHQQNVLCEARICHSGNTSLAHQGESRCSDNDLAALGSGGGLRCISEPFILSVPPTPAENCQGKFGTYVDIPGFHDPRIFWSGKGEPLMMVNTQ